MDKEPIIEVRHMVKNFGPTRALRDVDVSFYRGEMGMFIGLASNDVIGISIAAVGMAIFNYALNCMNLGGGGWQQIIMGVFVMCFYTFSAQLPNIKKLFRRLLKKEAAA